LLEHLERFRTISHSEGIEKHSIFISAFALWVLITDDLLYAFDQKGVGGLADAAVLQHLYQGIGESAAWFVVVGDGL
jgi:hypothetical protein